MLQTTDRAPDHIQPVPLLPLMAVLVLVEVLSSFEISMIFTALPAIVRETGNLEKAGWLQTGYLLVQAGTAAIAGRLGDMFGRRMVLIVVLFLCLLGSALSAISPDLDIVILGRAIQGASGAILPLCYGIVRRHTPPDRLPFCVSCLSGSFSTASGLGFLLGGVMTQVVGWHGIFYLTTIYSAIVIVPALLIIPHDKGRGAEGSFDWAGLLFVPATTLITLSLTLGGQWGWLSRTNLLALASGVLMLAGWVFHELRRVNPLLNIRLLARREILIGNLVFALAGLSMAQLPLVGMLLIQQPIATGAGFGVSPSYAGILKLPSNAVALLAAGVSGYLTQRFSDRRSILVGGALGLAAWLYILLFHDNLWGIVGVIVVGTFAWIMLLTSIPTMILHVSPVDRSSEASGLSVVIKGIFTGVGAQIATLQLATSTVFYEGNRYPAESAYILSFGFSSLMIIGIMLLTIFLRTSARPVSEALR